MSSREWVTLVAVWLLLTMIGVPGTSVAASMWVFWRLSWGEGE